MKMAVVARARERERERRNEWNERDKRRAKIHKFINYVLCGRNEGRRHSARKRSSHCRAYCASYQFIHFTWRETRDMTWKLSWIFLLFFKLISNFSAHNYHFLIVSVYAKRMEIRNVGLNAMKHDTSERRRSQERRWHNLYEDVSRLEAFSILSLKFKFIFIFSYTNDSFRC